MPTAFVTGATGFLGLNLVEQLSERGWIVVAYHRPTSDTACLTHFPVRLAEGDIADFEEAMKARASGRGLHAKSRVGVRRAIASGMAAVRHLDVLVPNLLRDDPLEVEAWKTARHIVRLPQAAEAAEPAADAAAATPPAAAPPIAPATPRKKDAA